MSDQPTAMTLRFRSIQALEALLKQTRDFEVGDGSNPGEKEHVPDNDARDAVLLAANDWMDSVEAWKRRLAEERGLR